MSVRELDDALASAATGIGYQADLDAVAAVSQSGHWHEAFREAIAKLHELLLVEPTINNAHLGAPTASDARCPALRGCPPA
jgi:hypothetical protein